MRQAMQLLADNAGKVTEMVSEQMKPVMDSVKTKVEEFIGVFVCAPMHA